MSIKMMSSKKGLYLTQEYVIQFSFEKKIVFRDDNTSKHSKGLFRFSVRKHHLLEIDGAKFEN